MQRRPNIRREDSGHLTDAQIIEQSLDEPDAFGLIFERYRDDVFAFVAKRLGRQAGIDITADVFLRALRIRFTYDLSRPNARPWLYGIASNLIGDALRKRSVRRRHRTSAATRLLGPIADPYDQALSDIQSRRLGPVITAALDELAEPQRAALILFAVDGLSYPEIAEYLDVALGTVKSRVSRAKHKMRSQLSRHGIETAEYEAEASRGP